MSVFKHIRYKKGLRHLTPEYGMRFILWILAHTIYRVRIENAHLIPHRGPAVIVANHVSFIDWFIITAASGRPVRFVMDHKIFKVPVLSLIFRFCRAIPIAPAKENAKIKEQAFDEISKALSMGDVVCIFPEGAITRDGLMKSFRPGVEEVLRRNPVPVIPFALTGLWGSFFSRANNGKAMNSLPRPTRRVITATGIKTLPATTSAKEMENIIRNVLDNKIED